MANDPTLAPDVPIERVAYTPTEVAAALGCSRVFIQNLIARGEIRSFKLGRKRLIPRAVVDELVAQATT
jgi:excisionase family DNA binding protein